MKFIYTTDRLYLRTLDERSADKILEFYPLWVFAACLYILLRNTIIYAILPT